MTRSPGVIHTLRQIRGRIGGTMSRKTLALVGTGLATAGVAAAATAGLASASATAEPSTISNARLAGHGAISPGPGRLASHSARPRTWLAIERTIAGRTWAPGAGYGPGHAGLPAQDRLTPVGMSRPQTRLTITPVRYQNAATIVHQDLHQKMGLRSAVIAVATAMQESTLLNINYGDLNSVGLFQQRPSIGWGTAAQILHPVHAADAFLRALRRYQAGDPGWARQPLWQTAQAVQNSGFPYAYAKWEAQAAQLVHSVTAKMY